MQEVTLSGSRMFVWPGVHTEAGENVRVLSRETKRAFVVTDRDCVEIARHVAMSLQQARFKVAGGLLPASKGVGKPATVRQIKEKLARYKPEETLVVAVGGTSLLHIAGRLTGVRPLFLVPTTLRAQLDTALGGSACAQVGSGWTTPLAVFSDPTLIRTVPLREFIAGLAEAVKCGMVQDPDLFEFLQSKAEAIRDRSLTAMEELVFRAGTVKAAAVNSPVPGPGARATFLYGHYVGGAIEKLAGAAVLHGEALAVGMEAEAFMAKQLGWADDDLLKAQNRLLKNLGLPTRAKGLPPERLAQPLLDRASAKLDLPDALGHARGPADVTPELLKAAVAAITKG
jgi:3-dehydroquinate synthase